MTREQQLERALRDLLMERSLYTEQAARQALGLDSYGNPVDNEPTYCACCGRMKTNHYGPYCTACEKI